MPHSGGLKLFRCVRCGRKAHRTFYVRVKVAANGFVMGKMTEFTHHPEDRRFAAFEICKKFIQEKPKHFGKICCKSQADCVKYTSKVFVFGKFHNQAGAGFQDGKLHNAPHEQAAAGQDCIFC